MSSSFPISSSSSAIFRPQNYQTQIQTPPPKKRKVLFQDSSFPSASASPSQIKKTTIEQLPTTQTRTMQARQVNLFNQPTPLLSTVANMFPRAVSPTARYAGSPPSSPVSNAASVLRPPKSPFHFSSIKITSQFVLKALEILDNMSISSDMRIIPMFGMRGEHSQVYKVQSTENLIPGVSNEDIYVKIFHEDVLKENGNYIEKVFLNNMFTQHAEIEAAGIRVVNILNKDTALEDGYLVVEKLIPFKMPWDESTKVADLSPENRAHLDYLLTLFRFGLTNPSDVALDIHRGNFGLDKSGNLVLLDLMEDSDPTDYAFRLYARKHALSLSNGNEEIYAKFKEAARELTPDLYSSMCE